MEREQPREQRQGPHMIPFPDGASISTGSALPDKDIFLNRGCAQAKGGGREGGGRREAGGRRGEGPGE